MRINRMKRVMLLLTIMLFSLMEAHAMWTYFIKETKTVEGITYNYWYKKYSGAIDSRRKVPFKGVGGVGDGASFAFLEVAPLAEDPYHYQGNIAITAQSIASGAFADCTALTSVSIPSNMGDGILMPAYIKSGAFSNCPALADVYTESECGIPSDAFDNYIYQHATLHVPQGKKQKFQSLEGWRNFVNIDDDTDEGELQEGDTFTAKTAEGVDMEFTVKDKNTRTIWVGTFQRVAIPTETGGIITIPVKVDGWYVRGISTQAFSGCSFLGGITIPEGIEIIDDNAFYNCESLTSINIPKSVTSLGSYHPFVGCTSLHNVTVASGNTKYDSRNNCNGIIETATNKLIFGTAGMTIPSSVTSIAPAAFLSNSELNTITIPEGVESIGQQAFMDCCNLQRVEIPKTVTHLDKEIFANCYYLYQISVATNNAVYDSRDYCNAIIETATNTLVEGCYNTVIPASVKHIGECAFGGRQWLNSMKLPEGLVSIGVNAFWLCTDLKEVTIPANVQTIGDYAFEGCLGLQDVYSQIEDPFDINENVFNVTYEVQGDLLVPLSTNHFTTATLHVPAGSKSKYQQAAGWKNFQNIVEMDGELKNGDVFTGLTVEGVEMEFIVKDASNKICWVGRGNSTKQAVDISTSGTVTIPSSINGYEVKGIEAYAFMDCAKLANVVVPEGIKSIAYGAFARCHGLTQLELPNSLTVLWSFALYDCTNMTSVSLGNQLEVIGQATFYGCSSLKSLELPSSLIAIYSYAFRDCSSLTEMHIPENVEYLEDWLFAGSCGVKKLTVDANNSYFYSLNNCILADVSANGETLGIVGYGCAGSTIPTDAKVKQIGPNAFELISGLSEIMIPDNISGIGQKAFALCSDLEKITIGKNVSLIEDMAFCGNTNLKQVYALNPVPVEIDDNVFHTEIVWNEDGSINSSKEFTTATLYVPYGSKAAYQQAAGWKNFQNIVEMVDIVSGDANGDGTVTVTDYIAVANYILGLNPANFNATAADVNGDNDVNVTDYVGVANIILYGNYQGPSANSMMAFGSDETLPWLEIGVTDNGKMNLLLHDSKPFSAFQMDIRLPEGVEIVEANMAKTNQTRNLGFAKLQDGTWRLLYGTLENKDVNLVGDNMLTLELAIANSAVGGYVTFDNIFLTDRNASTIQLNGIQSGLPTGINPIETGMVVNEDSYDLMGRKVDGSQLKKGVYVVNGKKMFVK